MEDTAYWLASSGLLSLLSYLIQDHLPTGGTIHSAWALPQQTLIKKMPYKVAYTAVGWRHFLN